MADNILLETGTNEAEVLEFFIGDKHFGINVAKIAQIVPFSKDNLTVVPDEEEAIMGSLSWQDHSVSLINLDLALHKTPTNRIESDRPVILVTEFNNVVNGFLCDGVNRIHRIRWDEMSPLSSYLEKYSSMVTGSVHVEGHDVLLVDFEYIVSQFFPETCMAYQASKIELERGAVARQDMKIIFAEDSPFIRNTITDLLGQAGYSQTVPHENGKDALDYIEGLVRQANQEEKEITDYMNLLLTDIEMPRLDGLTLCRQIKTELNLDIPVIIFSSLINEQMEQKCREVKADGYTTKPQIAKLVELLDAVLGVNTAPGGEEKV